MSSTFSHEFPKQSRGNPGANHWPLWERMAVRALVSVVFGKDYRRHIRKAKAAARREEAKQDEREREERRAEFNRSFEQAQNQLRKAARI